MIKVNYGNAAHQIALENAYIAIYPDYGAMNAKWKGLRAKLIKLRASLKPHLPTQLQSLLLKPYIDLVDLYDEYTKIDKVPDAIVGGLKKLFNYDFHKDKTKRADVIAEFFIDNMEVHTCHYCDMAYINSFVTDGMKKRHFDLDHSLDKGKCPVLALCLYNFVPSCPICNQRLKHTRQIEGTAEQRKKLSPTSELYNFERDVRIWIHNMNGSCSTLGFEKRMNDYEIRFDTSKDPDYELELKLFKTRDRYNYHKCEALRLLDLKERYTDSHILEMARLMIGSPNIKSTPGGMKIITQLKHDVFANEFSKNFHRTLGKMREDILKGK